MSKPAIAETTTKLFQLLEPFESEDRQKVIAATLTLLGEKHLISSGHPSGNASNLGGNLQNTPVNTASPKVQEYFNQKDPNTKLEELAVAARYRELTESAETHTKEDLKRIIGAARRNFDAKNFKRDLDNGKKGGYFNRGATITLAYFGQKYVDALPDRKVVKTLKKPKRSARRAQIKPSKVTSKLKS